MNFYDALNLMQHTQQPVVITDGDARLSVRFPDEQTDNPDQQLCIEHSGRWLAIMPSTRYFETEWELIDTNDQ